MIPFKDVTLADRDTITSFTMKSDRRNCDLSFSNLCSWRFLYDTQFAVVDNFLVFKFWAGEQLAYMMPVGTGDLKAVLWELIEDARKENQHFCMLGVCSNMRADLEAILPGQFTFTEDRDYADYIYLRSDLSTLKGKKFQAKRNHINRFRNTYPDYEYTPITPDRIQECLDLEAEWCKVNHCDQQEGTGNERRALIYALHNFDALGLTGGILHVNSKIVAFTFGMPINHETFGVHVEKADTNIEGAYAMINYEFANRIPEQYIYINREEDLGLEGLRKAKLSYQPVTILEKYMACLKEHPMNMVNGKLFINMMIKEQVKALWKVCFDDSEEFVEMYFRLRYKTEVNVAIKSGDEVISALQMLPYPMTFGGETVQTSYISGACTHPDFRSKGVMRELLSQSFARMLRNGVHFSTLIPAEPWLFDYYARMGYASVFKYSTKEIVLPEFIPSKEIAVSVVSEFQEEVYSYLNKKLSERACCIQHTSEDFQVIMTDLAISGGYLFVARQENEIKGITIIYKGDKHIIINELCADDKDVEYSLLYAISSTPAASAWFNYCLLKINSLNIR